MTKSAQVVEDHVEVAKALAAAQAALEEAFRDREACRKEVERSRALNEQLQSELQLARSSCSSEVISFSEEDFKAELSAMWRKAFKRKQQQTSMTLEDVRECFLNLIKKCSWSSEALKEKEYKDDETLKEELLDEVMACWAEAVRAKVVAEARLARQVSLAKELAEEREAAHKREAELLSQLEAAKAALKRVERHPHFEASLHGSNHLSEKLEEKVRHGSVNPRKIAKLRATAGLRTPSLPPFPHFQEPSPCIPQLRRQGTRHSI